VLCRWIVEDGHKPTEPDLVAFLKEAAEGGCSQQVAGLLRDLPLTEVNDDLIEVRVRERAGVEKRAHVYV
jgi:hypothetical protein